MRGFAISMISLVLLSVVGCRDERPAGISAVVPAAAEPELSAATKDVLARLRAAGIPVARTRPVLARSLGADTCAAVLIEHGPGLSVCDFKDAAAAREGARASHEKYDALLPGRQLLVRGESLITITSGAPGARATDDVIAALSP